MPSLAIHFPEKETPSTLVLKGARITVGRRPNNTIQILDRTLSASHAEFIEEPDGHYRLHDLGSTNGTRVNGEAATDFQLMEPCTIAFGTFECRFDPAPAAAVEEAEVLPTRAEVESLRKENIGLQKTLATAREEIESLRTAANGAGESEGNDVLTSELKGLIAERAELKEALQRQAQDLERLRSELAVARRDRGNLESALRDLRMEHERLKSETPTVPSSNETAAPALQTPAPKAEPVQPSWPKVTAPAPSPAAAPLAPAALKPTPPAAKTTPLPRPAAPMAPKPAAPLPKPSLPPPSAPSLAPTKSPASTGAPTGRPIPKFTPAQKQE